MLQHLRSADLRAVPNAVVGVRKGMPGAGFVWLKKTGNTRGSELASKKQHVLLSVLKSAEAWRTPKFVVPRTFANACIKYT